ncbi:uncharacterized protein LOC128680381 [Plodia interpunctella]|uniref:uncharacterized protein LOC128680381 n=1 Tax=Plodia interpunctella TaxID=58824 RepID=UPI00236875DB|nr:uncharacterized protein LOC128680381 [Plodia interpunctella]
MTTQRSPIISTNRPGLMKTPVSSFGSDPQLYDSTKNIDSGSDFITRRMKRKHSNESPDFESIIYQMKEMFASFEKKQNLKLDAISQQNLEIQKSITFLSSRYDDLLNKVQTLETTNRSYEQKIESLESKIEVLERNSRTSSVEIRNVPKQNVENKLFLRSLVKRACETVQQPLSDSDINDVYRLKTKKETGNHIIVNFTSTICKDGFINQCRAYNKTHKENKLNTSHIGLPGPSKPIFVDELLTSLGKRLAYLARQLVKENSYHSTWTSYGKVYLRKTQNSPVLRIDCETDFDKLSSK